MDKTYLDKISNEIRYNNKSENGNIKFGDVDCSNRNTMYHIGDIMIKGNQISRLLEIQDISELNLNIDCYSAMLNESINDKSNMTEEENNKLAEHILEADVNRLFDSNIVVAEALHSSIGSLCELGILHGWQTAGEKIDEITNDDTLSDKEIVDRIKMLRNKLDKDIYVHSFDLRNTNLKEAKWRRSHSINQLLYGMILRLASDKDILKWEDILRKLKERY